MRKKFKALFVSLSFGWLLLLIGCQNDINVVREDVNNLHRGTGEQIIAFGDSIF
jgi:hypothetical protein